MNVLIATGLLKKEGKMVTCNQPFEEERSIHGRSNTRQLYEKKRILAEMMKKAESIEEKRKKLQKIEEKKRLIEYVINRNRNQHDSLNENAILRFPLLGFIL